MSLDWVEVLTTFSIHSAKRRKIDESADKGERLSIINLLQTCLRKKHVQNQSAINFMAKDLKSLSCKKYCFFLEK